MYSKFILLKLFSFICAIMISKFFTLLLFVNSYEFTILVNSAYVEFTTFNVRKTQHVLF